MSNLKAELHRLYSEQADELAHQRRERAVMRQREWDSLSWWDRLMRRLRLLLKGEEPLPASTLLNVFGRALEDLEEYPLLAESKLESVLVQSSESPEEVIAVRELLHRRKVEQQRAEEAMFLQFVSSEWELSS